IGIEQCDKAVEFTATRCPKEGVDHLPLPSKIRIRSWYVCPLDSPPCPAGKLSGCLDGSPDHGSDLLEGQLEHVVQHECESLRRGESVEHDENGEADSVSEQRFL